MSDKYRNIFSYYRAPSRVGGKAKTEVLENNLTKALVNTLDLCPRLGTAFVEWLNGKIENQGLGVRLATGPIDWGILSTPDKEEIRKLSRDNILMLGIKKRNSEDVCRPNERAKPELDGKIVGEDWLIGIESKINGMDLEQFRQEKEWLETDKSLVLNWQQVHDFFCEQDKAQCGEAEKLLIQQFTDFLKSSGLVSFPGFQPKHFALFSGDAGQWQDNDRTALRDLMKALRGDLCHYKYDGESELNTLYQECDAEVKGLRRRNSSPDSVDIKYYLRRVGEPVLVDIQITRNQDEDEPSLAVFACVDGEEALRDLSRRLGRHSDGLLRVLRRKRTKLNDYRVELLNSSRKYEELMPSCSLGHITKDQLRMIQCELRENANIKGSVFSITRYFTADEITAETKEDQLKMIADAMITLCPFVQFATRNKKWKAVDWRLLGRDAL